jgi:lipid-A-disaccharide synthase
MKKTKVFIIAGEVSGDVLGAEIMQMAAARAEFSGVGGQMMSAAGLKSIFPISDLSAMGLFDVIKKSRTLLRRIKQTADAIVAAGPDIVLTIDSSSFAVRVIKRVRRGMSGGPVPRFYHVVAPMVWAWGRGRAKKYARIWDKLFCFFDFERPYFTKYGLD